jgi:hypothetical protein
VSAQGQPCRPAWDKLYLNKNARSHTLSPCSSPLQNGALPWRAYHVPPFPESHSLTLGVGGSCQPTFGWSAVTGAHRENERIAAEDGRGLQVQDLIAYILTRL